MFGGLLLAVLLVAALWMSAPWWLARVAEHELAGLGFDTLAIDIEQIGFGHSRIARLHVKRTDGSLELDAAHAGLSYSMSGLLGLQLDSLRLESLDIAVFPAPANEYNKALNPLPPAVMFAAIPVKRIDIERISLRRLDAGQAILQHLIGRAAYADKALQFSLGETDAQGLQAELSLHASGSCGGLLSHAGMQIVRMDCLLSQEQSRTVLQGKLQADLGRLDSLLAVWVSMPEHRLTGSMQATWNAELPGGMNAAGMPQWSLESTFNIDADMGASQWSLKGRVGYAPGKGIWSIADDSLVRFGEGLRSGLSFAGLSGGFSEGDALTLSLNKGGVFRLQDLSFGQATLAKVDVRLKSMVPLTFSDDILLSRAVDIDMHMSRMDLGKYSVSSRGIRLHLKAGKLLAPSGSLVADGVLPDADGLNLPTGSLQADVQLNAVSLTAQGGFVADDGILQLDWKLRHSLVQDAGQLNVRAVPLRFPEAAPLLHGLAGTKDGLLLQAGSLTATGQLTWSTNRSAAVVPLHVDQLQGVYRGHSFSGLSGDVNVVVDARTLRLSSENLSALMYDPGLPLADISMRAGVNYPFDGKPGAVLRDVRAKALGGLISSQVIDIDLARKSNPFVLRLEHVEVRQLVEFRKQEGLFADGLLDGTLPFDWTDKGLNMSAGVLDARMPGGLIRYLGTESMRQMAAGDRVVGMAMQVLGDFHFKVLHTQADYHPDGQLALHIELKGNNPGYENGRPIELNLNIEENVLKLLQSLRMADEISDRVEKSIRKKAGGN